jgi:choice-of-anchor A domain-containing protein
MRISKNSIITGAAILTTITTAGCQAPADSSKSHLSSLGLEDARSSLNKCLSSSASVVAFSDTNVNFSGNANIKGSVVLLGGSSIRLSGNAKIAEKLYTPSNDKISASGNASAGEVVVRDLTGNEKNVLDFVDSLATLSETGSIQQINSSMTLHGNGSLNVIQVNGDLALSGRQTLTLDGTANDLFLINVAGNVSLFGNSNIVVSGTLPPENVLFRLPRSGANVQLAGNGNVQGTFIAPRGTAQISGNGHIQGSVLAWNSITLTGNGLTFDPAPFCPVAVIDPSPTPSASPSASPSVEPSASPSVDPSASPSVDPSASPSVEPSASPSVDPSASPSVEPSASPSPTASPTGSSTTPSPSPSPMPTTCTGAFCGGIIGV